MSSPHARIALPHTDLRTSQIGLGSSFGLSPEDIELAFEHGINYFYWGSIRRPGFGRGVRNLAKRAREDMVVVLQSYARWPGAFMQRTVESGLRRLGIEYADILLLGWYNSKPPAGILDAAHALRESGRVRCLMMSGHNRSFFPEIAKENLFDLLMVRYNAAHRGAEVDVFPLLPGGDEHPSIVAYTATRWGSLLDRKKMPEGERVPRASDCYRFCLTNRDVDMVLCGAANTSHVREAVAALEAGPMDADELAWMRRVGDHVYGRSPVRSALD